MKIGTGIYLEKVKENLDFYQESYNVLELQDFVMPDNLGKNYEKLIKEYKSLLKNYKGTLTLHGPYIDLHPTSFDPLIREVSIKRYRQTLMAANELNAKYIVIHSDYDIGKVYDGYEDYLFEESILSWKELIKEFEYMKVTAVMENVHNINPNLIKRIINEINSPYLKACLDIGHANVYSNVNLTQWLDDYKEELAYIHLHDNNGKKDQHLPIGRGNIDFKGFFNKIKQISQDLIIICEIFGDIDEQYENLVELTKLMDKY